MFAVEPLLLPVCVVDHDRGLFHDQQASYENSKHQAQVELGTRFDGSQTSDRFGGGGGHD